MRIASIVTTVLLAGLAESAFAQAESGRAQPTDGWFYGAAVGVPGYGREAMPELFTAAVTFAKIQPRELGGDFWLGTIPRGIPEGILIAGVRANAVMPFPVARGVSLLPSAGLTAMGGASAGGGGGIAGLNAGLSVVLGDLLRAGATVHYFGSSTRPFWLFEVGLLTPPR